VKKIRGRRLQPRISQSTRRALLVEALEDRSLPSSGLPAVLLTTGANPSTQLFVADQDFTTPEGHALWGGLLNHVYDPDGKSVQVTAVDGRPANVGVPTKLPSGAVVTVNADGSFNYTPSSHFLGTDSVKITAGDGSASTTAFAYIDMVPLVGSWSSWANSGQTQSIPYYEGLLDSSPNGSLKVTAINGNTVAIGTQITLPSGASLQVNADGSLSYTSPANYTGNDSFIFTASDGLNIANATATIYVYPPSPPPPPPSDYVYVYDWHSFNAATGQPLIVPAANGLLEYDFDTSGAPIQISAINGNAVSFGAPINLPSGATLTVNADGSFTYVSAAGYEGNNLFTFTAGDGTTSESAFVQINVFAPGIYLNGENPDYYTDAWHKVSSNLLANAYDTSGNTLEITSVNGNPAAVGTAITLPSGATLTVGGNGNFTYVPNPSFAGNDGFTFTVGDGTFSILATAAVHVAPVVNDWSTSIIAGQALSVDNYNGLLTQTCYFDFPLSITAVDGSPVNISTPTILPSGATLIVNGDGSFSYTPAPGFAGTDTFTFTASDGPNCTTATATIYVAPTLYLGGSTFRTYTRVKLTRLPGDGLLSGADDTQGRIPRIISVDGSAANVGMPITLASGATVTVNANGSFVYTPAAGFSGDDCFSVTASDGLTNVNVTESINVQEPVLDVNDRAFVIAANQTLTVQGYNNLVPYTFDMVGDTLQVRAINGTALSAGTPILLASGATLTVNTDGSFTYVPAAGYTGTDRFTFTITDGLVNATATATINVVPPFIDLPDASYPTSFGQTLTIGGGTGLLANLSDSPGLAPTVTAINGSTAGVGTPITLPSGATLTVNADGSFTYTPAAGFAGNDSFTFTAGDGPTSASATVIINVALITNKAYALSESLGTNAVLQLNAAGGLLSSEAYAGVGGVQITEVNGVAAAVGTTIMLNSGAELTVNADGSFTYMVANGFVGSDTFTATAGDGAISQTSTITINVTSWQDWVYGCLPAPFIMPICATTELQGFHLQTEQYLPTSRLVFPVPALPQSLSFTARIGQTLTFDSADGLLATDDTSAQVAAVNGRVYNVGSVITLASGATLLVNPDGSFAYTPAAGFSGQDSFAFTVMDYGNFSTETASINVQRSVLSVGNVKFTTTADRTLTGATGALLARTNAGTVTITAVNGASGNVGGPITLPSGATLTVNADGSFTYVPASGFTGVDSFTFTATDGVTSVTAIARINVKAPGLHLTHLVYHSSPLGTLTVDSFHGLLANVQDPSGGTLNVIAINGDPVIVGVPLILASGATLTVNADGSFIYAPATSSPPPNLLYPLSPPDSDTFTFTVSDGAYTATAQVTICMDFPCFDSQAVSVRRTPF
jgi:hypothetical protein